MKCKFSTTISKSMVHYCRWNFNKISW